MYLKQITIQNKTLKFPTYFPDGTRAVVRSLDSEDLDEAKVEGLVVNTYHLMTQPGATVLKQLGGVKKFMNWDGFIASDSGGFQLFSMIHRNKSQGKITDKGVTFYPHGNKKKKVLFTPENSIQVQFNIGADILICLDDFTPHKASQEMIEKTVERTVEWAKRCKEEFEKQVEQRRLKEAERPLLLSVIQGDVDKSAREKCAKELMKIGFDGYGFGGWPLDEEGALDVDIMKFTASCTPDDLPRFALGVGTPQDIVEGFKMGYHIFDCVLPTRDARHYRLYTFTKDPAEIDALEEKRVHDYLYILREKYTRDERPISEFCDCHACQNYSRAYLQHLFKIEDSLAWRLATIHNLRVYTLLIENLRRYGS